MLIFSFLILFSVLFSSSVWLEICNFIDPLETVFGLILYYFELFVSVAFI